MEDIIEKNYYNQNFSILNPIIGLAIKSLHFERVTFSIGKEQIVSGIGDLIITFFDREKNKNYNVSFKPKGSDSAGGDIYGFEFFQIEDNAIQSCNGQILYHENYKIEGLVFYGEEKEEAITDTDTINFFYHKLEKKPNKVIVKKKTIDIIQFKLANHGNCYLYSGGERDFHMSLNFPLSHEAWLILQKDSYQAMEKEFLELKRIE